jgi:hypothetical protein
MKFDLDRMLWQQAGREIGIVNSSSAALQKLDVRARTMAKLCENKDSLNGKDSIMRYIHTVRHIPRLQSSLAELELEPGWSLYLLCASAKKNECEQA